MATNLKRNYRFVWSSLDIFFVFTLILLRDCKKTCQHSRRFFLFRPPFPSISVVCLDLGLMAEVYNQLEHKKVATNRYFDVNTVRWIRWKCSTHRPYLWLIFVPGFFYSVCSCSVLLFLTCLLTEYKSLRGFINIRKETPVYSINLKENCNKSPRKCPAFTRKSIKVAHPHDIFLIFVNLKESAYHRPPSHCNTLFSIKMNNDTMKLLPAFWKWILNID